MQFLMQKDKEVKKKIHRIIDSNGVNPEETD